MLNLADIFRYFLETERSFLPLEEELHIVKAYLEVERLRLGEKLRVEIDVDPETLTVPIPILSIQPLVENAVKHGIAPKPGGGLVQLEARFDDAERWRHGARYRRRISPRDWLEDRRGPGKRDAPVAALLRLGARNSRFNSDASGTTVSFSIPASLASLTARTWQSPGRLSGESSDRRRRADRAADSARARGIHARRSKSPAKPPPAPKRWRAFWS